MADDPLDELVSSVSDGVPVDWASAESETGSTGPGKSLRALRDVSRIADFHRALQRAATPAAPGSVVSNESGGSPASWGPFTLLERVGAGASGEVWRAWDGSLDREVALKFLQERSVESGGEGATALLHEARTLARVRHPSVVTVYGIGEHDGRAGMWMEFLRGPTLAAEIERSGRLSARDVVRMGLQLSGALEALDRAGLVHRDLKPSNILIESDGRVVLMDFGLGWRRRLFAPDAPRRGSGTPLFMAPSLLAGGSATPRTDLYALGVALRWSLEGGPPFQARTMGELREQASRGPDRSLAIERPDAPPGLVAAIEGAMHVGDESPPFSASAMGSLLRDAAVALEGNVPAARSGRPSIAVLPFLNRSLDPTDEYFSEGLADELLTVLSRIRGLHVAARTSSFQFRGKNEPLSVIGERLGVETILEGSVRRSPERVRITVRLVRVADGSQLWSDTYDRTFDDLFAAQDDIAQRVVEELRAALLPATAPAVAAEELRAEVAAAARGRGRDPEAHRLFLQGRHLVYRKTPDEVAAGIECLRQAVARDPSHALAWTALGSAYADQVHMDVAPIEAGYARAREAVLRALQVEPELAEGHARLARIQVVHDRDWPGAEASFLRALDRDPANVTALHGAAILLQTLGRSGQAIELNLRAIARDPLVAATHNNLGCVYYESGRLEEAEAALRKSLELSPQRYGTRSFLAQVLAHQGRGDEAQAEANEEQDDVYRLLALVLIHHRCGRATESDAALEELTRLHAEGNPLQIAEAHGSRGEVEAAFEWLERAERQGDPGLAHILPSTHFRSVHSDPRWSAFLKQLGIAP